VKQKLNWDIYSNQERIKGIEELKSIISSHDGFIVNHNFFSDLALSLTIEIEENKIKGLHNALGNAVAVSDLEQKTLDPESTKEWWVFLNVSFNKGTGELKNNIPSV
jgi:hypothetical protein